MSLSLAFRVHYRYSSFLFFFNDTATTEIYTLSLHDALPILITWRSVRPRSRFMVKNASPVDVRPLSTGEAFLDRKSTRLNSSHDQISYAVFCLKKKKTERMTISFCRATPRASQRLQRYAYTS